jgi:hypothetical protein
MIRRLPLALLLVAAAAHAQPSPDKADAKALLHSGLKLFQAKDYLGALAVFRDAYARFPSAKLLLNIGTTLRQLDRNAEAANAYQRYLDAPDADAAKRPEVTKVLAALDAKVGTLDLEVTSGATVVVAGETLEPNVTRWRVPPGAIAIRATADRHQPGELAVTATAGAVTSVRLELAPVVEAPPPRTVAAAAPSTLGVAAELRPDAPSRLGALVLAHVDPANGGGAALVGVVANPTARLQLQAAALLGGTQGGYAGASFALLTGRVRPVLVAGVPIFSSNGARFALRGAGGVELALHRHLTLVAELGVERMLNAEAGRAETLFVPALGAIARL